MWFGEKKMLTSCFFSSSFPPAGDPKTWQNKSLPGDPNYLVGANCVSVLIDHFWRGRQLVCYWMLDCEVCREGVAVGGNTSDAPPPSCDAPPPLLRGGGAKLDEGRTRCSHVVYCVLKFQKKKKEKKPDTHKRSVWGGQRPRGWAPQFCFLFRWEL